MRGETDKKEEAPNPHKRWVWDFFYGLELLSRFELETSSLPRMRSTA